MSYLIPKIKEILLDIIKTMVKYPWLFAKNPEKDFTRKRKCLITIGGTTM
ncbi:MAG: hypothetical protein RR744_04565 [Cellulosilyticaceae bacterium]